MKVGFGYDLENWGVFSFPDLYDPVFDPNALVVCLAGSDPSLLVKVVCQGRHKFINMQCALNNCRDCIRKNLSSIDVACFAFGVDNVVPNDNRFKFNQKRDRIISRRRICGLGRRRNCGGSTVHYYDIKNIRWKNRVGEIQSSY